MNICDTIYAPTPWMAWSIPYILRIIREHINYTDITNGRVVYNSYLYAIPRWKQVDL